MSDIETQRRKIDAYLLESLSAELDALNRYPIDRYSKWAYVRALEFYWTSSRALRHLREGVDRLRILDEGGRETLLVAQTKRGQALTLSVKRRSPNGTVASALARDYGEAVLLRDECGVQGYDAWIEDADGQIVR